MKSTAAKTASAQGSSPESSSPTSARLLKGRPPDPPTDGGEAPLGEATHPDLVAKAEEAVRPVAVQNGRLLATYLGLHLDRDKDKKKLAHLDFSFPLEEAHNSYLPRKVKEAWNWLSESGNKLVQVQGIDAITLDVFTTPTRAQRLIHVAGAEFIKAIISVVEEVGKGKATMVTRFAFRLRVERNDEVIHFAAWNDGEEFWITMPATQGDLE